MTNMLIALCGVAVSVGLFCVVLVLRTISNQVRDLSMRVSASTGTKPATESASESSRHVDDDDLGQKVEPKS